jgi:hypothetical protein
MSILSRLFGCQTNGPAQNSGRARSVGTGYTSPFATRAPRTWDDVVKSITGSVQPNHPGTASEGDRARFANHSATGFRHGPNSPYPDGYNAQSDNSQSGPPAHVDAVRRIFGGAAPTNIHPIGEPAQRLQARGEETDV